MTPISQRAALAAFGSLLLVICTSHLRLQAEEPKVSSETRPWHDGRITGTEKLTTEVFKDYTITTYVRFGRGPVNPQDDWQSQRIVEYKDADKKLLKSAELVESHDILSVKEGRRTELSWHEVDGSRLLILCIHNTYVSGGSFVDRLFARHSADNVLLSGFEYRAYRHSGETHEYYDTVDPEKHAWKKTDTKPEDTTGCDDAKFPFQLLKEKPL